MSERMRLRERYNLLDYARIKGVETPEPELTRKKMSLLTRIGL